MSHPMWVRGLKHQSLRSVVCRSMSHPMWVRGLKRALRSEKAINVVAPYVGAWIETIQNESRKRITVGRTLCGCVD